MSSELIIESIVVAVIVFSFIAKFLPKSKPKETHFKCSRCGVVAQHTERTIEAWRNNKNKFFCQSCHTKWIQSRPPQERDRFYSNHRSGSGCLGVAVLFVLIPVIGFYLM